MYEEDFVLTEEIEFEIEDRKFTYKPVTAADELKWFDEYVEIVDGKTVQDFDKKTRCKLRNLIKVPYDKELINKAIGINKVWVDLNNEERSKFLGKLKPSFFDKILIKINRIDLSDNKQIKKN